jgi:hypothetical protein
VSRIIYGPKFYFPIFGEEGGTQRLHLGLFRRRMDERVCGVYFAYRIYGDRWWRACYVRGVSA